MSELVAGERLNLFCFPYGGAGVSCYYGWQERLPTHVRVQAVEYPGRDSRWEEAPCVTLDQLAEDFLDRHRSACRGRFAFFGHSLGALTGFEVARRLGESAQRSPEVLFVSGSPAPHISRTRPAISHLPKQKFLRALVEKFDVSSVLLKDTEVADMMYPILQADFQVVEEYKYEETEPLTCPIVALGGTQDVEASEDSVSAWHRHTSSDFELQMIEGGHFFVNEQQSQVLDLLVSRLKTRT